jgi:hypothetical protein
MRGSADEREFLGGILGALLETGMCHQCVPSMREVTLYSTLSWRHRDADGDICLGVVRR